MQTTVAQILNGEFTLKGDVRCDKRTHDGKKPDFGMVKFEDSKVWFLAVQHDGTLPSPKRRSQLWVELTGLKTVINTHD